MSRGGRSRERLGRDRVPPQFLPSRKCFTTPLNRSEAVLAENVEAFNTRRTKRQKLASTRGEQSTVAALSPYPSSCRIHTPSRGLFKLHQASLSGLGSTKNATERVGDSTSRLSTPDLAVDPYAGALAIAVELEPEASSLYQRDAFQPDRRVTVSVRYIRRALQTASPTSQLQVPSSICRM